MELIKKHWGFLAGLLFVCAVAYASGYTGDFVRLRPGTLPSAGSDGELRVDSGDSNKLKKYSVTNSAWEEISGSGGGSGINYFSDFQADTIGNVSEFDDTSAIVDGTGGSPANLATASETSNPLSGDASYKLSKDTGANAQYEGFSVLTDTPDRTSVVGGETVYVTFNYETSANYDNDASGEQVSIYVYRVGSNTLESCNARDVLSGSFTNALPVAPDGGQYQCVTTLESTDTAVRVIFGITGTGTSTWDIVVDKIKVGPDAVVTAPIVTEWQEYDLTIGGSTSAPTVATTVTTNVAYWRRVGDSAQIIFSYQHTDSTGTASGTGSYLFPAPSECTIDSTKLSNNSGVPTVGSAQVFSGSTAAVGVVGRSGNNLLLYVGNDASAPTTVGSSFLPITGSTVQYNFHAQVPCEEFSGNAILSTTQANYRNLTAKYKGDPASTTANNPIIVPTLVEDDFSAYSTSTGLFTSPAGGKIKIYGVVVSACTGGIALNGYKNGSSADAPLGYLDSNGEATFVGYIEDVSAGDTVSVRPSSTCDFQVIRLQFEHIPLIGSTFSVYGPYEYTEAECTFQSLTTSATSFIDATGASISLTPGTWQVCYEASVFNEWISGTPANSCQTIVRDGSDNLINGTSRLKTEYLDSTYPSHVDAASGCAEVTITESTTYKLSLESSNGNTVARCSFWCGGNWTSGLTSPDGETKIWARRMK